MSRRCACTAYLRKDGTCPYGCTSTLRAPRRRAQRTASTRVAADAVKVATEKALAYDAAVEAAIVAAADYAVAKAVADDMRARTGKHNGLYLTRQDAARGTLRADPRYRRDFIRMSVIVRRGWRRRVR